MSNGTNDKETIRQWLEEQFGVVVEGQGAVSVVSLMHNAHSGEVPLFATTAKQNLPSWGKPPELAELLDLIASRHAKGIAGGGSQQFQVVICRGDSGKVTAVLPFVRVSAAAVSANGSLATEPPTTTGMVQMAQRMSEIVLQGTTQKDLAVTQVMGGLLDKVLARLDVSEKRSDERAQAAMNLLVEFHKTVQSAQLRMLLVDGARKVLPLVPALASTTLGIDVPQDVAENSFFDAMVESHSGEELQRYVQLLAPPANAVAADHLARAQRRKAQRDAERARLPSYDRAAEDAAGRAYTAVLGADPLKDAGAKIIADLDHRANGTNGHGTNGNGHTKPADNAAGNDSGDQVLKDLFNAFGPQAASIVALVEAKHPSLAARVRKFAALAEQPKEKP